MEFKKHRDPGGYEYFVLGGDVGGTHTNLGIAGVRGNRVELVYSVHYNSHTLGSFDQALKETLDHAKSAGISITQACIGIAGPVRDCEFSKPTNLSWEVDARKIAEDNCLESCFLINDFQAIGYGINFLGKEDMRKVMGSEGEEKHTIALLGAGTGFGKSMLVYSRADQCYFPVASEGGHADFPAQSQFDLDLIDFIRKRTGKNQISYEEILAGKGLENIYLFLREKFSYEHTRYTEEIDRASDKPSLISEYRKADETCKETFRIYAGYYGRCAKNFALESLSLGGIYIAGGVSAKNPEIFDSESFREEFLKTTKHHSFLLDMPVYVIVNYEVSLHGACYAAYLGREKICFK